MQQRSMILSAAVVLILGMVGCTTGPQTARDYTGDYLGSTSGAPPSTIELTVSGDNITGTGLIKTNIQYGNSGNESDLVITGRRSGAEITTMSATVTFNKNITTGDPDPTWVLYTGELSFTGIFNKTGAVTGAFGGEASSGGNQITLSGTWIAVKQDAASGIIKP